MTDIAPEPQAAAAPTDYEALYRAEVQGRIAEREKYKPFAQAVGQLDAQSREVIIALAQAAAEGDLDAIADWSAHTYRNLRGADLVNAIAAEQTGQTSPAQPQPTEQQPQYVTIEQAAEMARREAERTVTTQNLASRIAGELASAGYPAETPHGQTIITYAMQTGLPIADAIAWYDNELPAVLQRRQAAAATISSSIPMTAPAGAPAASSVPVNATPRERAIARLNSANRQPGS